MATQVQNRRGTTAEHSTFTGANGELTVDTTKRTLVVHDGATAGGRPLLREDQSNLPTSAPTTGIYNASGSLVISTGGSGRLFVDSSGNVLIGETGAAYRLLTVNQTGTTGGEYGIRVSQQSATTNAIDITIDSANGVSKLFQRSTIPLVFGTNDTERLRITSTGTVNIVGAGSAGSTQAVSFNGSAPVDSLVVDSSGRLLVGTSTSSAEAKFIVQGGATAAGGAINIQRNVTTASAGSTIGFINFANSANNVGATISADGDGTWSAGTSHPTLLKFSVTPDGGSSPTTSPSAMTINSGQEVLIGYSTDNGAYKLQVNSQIFATSATIATSDGRYKENVVTLDGCVDLVKALRPVSFDWKAQQPITRVDEDGETVVVREAHNFPDGKQVGFIAQEVEKVLADKPWLGSVIKQNVRPAVTDNDGNELAPEEEFLGIAEGNLIAVLTSALQEAIGEIESLKARVAALETP